MAIEIGAVETIMLKYIKSILIIGILAVSFYFIGGEQLKYSVVEKNISDCENVLPEPMDGTVVEQKMTAKEDYLESITFQPFTYGRTNQGIIDIQLLDDSGNTLSTQAVSAQDCADGVPYTVGFGKKISLNKGEQYIIRFIFREGNGENPSLYYSSFATDNFEREKEVFTVDNEYVDGTICLGTRGGRVEIFGEYYWCFVLGFAIAIVAYMAWSEHRSRKGKFTVATLFIAIWKKYEFLIRQLVSRDFKVKYKRSILGYCWSFLNPLLTMLVQYIVFSTIFRSGIENYPVYLLSGNIIFSFFTDAVGQGLMSIIGNASLITKVYVPKYIYPATKVMSCSINLFISLIPLLLVTLLTGGRVNLTLLLLPYALACLLIFCMGMVLLLSAANVFFRDVQYLWGIVSLVWMYATPIFYPADIIPGNLRFIQTINPMFHIISFIRSILIDGISPSPDVYLTCFVGAIITLAIGATVFKKTQGKFVLYI